MKRKGIIVCDIVPRKNQQAGNNHDEWNITGGSKVRKRCDKKVFYNKGFLPGLFYGQDILNKLVGVEFMYLNRKKALLVLFLSLPLLLALVPGVGEAAMVSTGDYVKVGRGEVIDDDVYLFGDTVTVSGTVLGDLIIFSREAIVDGTVKGSLLVFAETIRINGEIEGSARGGANTIFFQGSTGRDLMMAAGSINIDGSIGNDYYGAAGNSTVGGTVGRNIQASMSSLEINALVGGDINTYVSELAFGPEARVGGKVTYTSEKEAAIDSRAVIGGEVKRLDPPSETVVASPGLAAWSFIRPVLSLLAVSLLMVLIFPGLTAGTAQMIKKRPGRSSGFGALAVFVAPVAALILLITVIGIPISMLSMLLYAVLIYLTRIFAGYFLAQLAFERLNKKLHPVWIALIGVLVLALLVKIPYVGWLIHLAAVIIASGAFILYLVDQKEKMRAKEIHLE